MALLNAAAVCGRTAILASDTKPSMLTVKNRTALQLPVTVCSRRFTAPTDLLLYLKDHLWQAQCAKHFPGSAVYLGLGSSLRTTPLFFSVYLPLRFPIEQFSSQCINEDQWRKVANHTLHNYLLGGLRTAISMIKTDGNGGQTYGNNTDNAEQPEIVGSI